MNPKKKDNNKSKSGVCLLCNDGVKHENLGGHVSEHTTYTMDCIAALMIKVQSLERQVNKLKKDIKKHHDE